MIATRRRRLRWTARMVWDAPRQARFPFSSPRAIRAAQERRIRAIVDHAHQHVPYYREAMGRLGLRPGDIRTGADLARLPLIERNDLQRDPEYFRSRALPLADCVPLQSGGTTGSPVTVFRDPRSFLEEAAQRERQRSLVARLAGSRFRYREATIVPEDSSVVDALDAVRRNSILPTSLRVQRKLFSMWRAPGELLPELDRHRPDVIASYGSYLEALFVHLRRTRATIHLPHVVVYSGDGVTEGIRDFILGEVGIELLSSYNAIETPGVGFECEAHRGYHLNIDRCPVRLIGPAGTTAPTGEGGEVVVSNLVNRGTILLNYRLGDLASPVSGACPCGRNLPMLSFLEGRTAAWIDLGDGRTLHPQAVRFGLRKERDIWRYQVVQEGRRRFLLRAVVGPQCDRHAAAPRLAALVGKELGGDAEVRVEFAEDLAGGTGGKVESVIALPPIAAAAGDRVA
jgi:phenylacetate-CoA ligase